MSDSKLPLLEDILCANGVKICEMKHANTWRSNNCVGFN